MQIMYALRLPLLMLAWKLRSKLYVNLVAKQCSGYASSDRVWAGSDRVWTGSDRIWAGSDRIWAGSDRIWAGSDIIWESSDRI